MGEYDDYSMLNGDEAVAGICHARGTNVGLPPVWLPYFSVEDLDASLEGVVGHGGEVVVPVRSLGASMRYAVIRDPSGAAAALFENTAPESA